LTEPRDAEDESPTPIVTPRPDFDIKIGILLERVERTLKAMAEA